jgi:exonuclease SbcC
VLEGAEKALADHPALEVPVDGSLEPAKAKTAAALRLAQLAPIMKQELVLDQAEKDIGDLQRELGEIEGLTATKTNRKTEIERDLSKRFSIEKELTALAPKVKLEAALQNAAARIEDLNKQILREQQDKAAREAQIQDLDARLATRPELDAARLKASGVLDDAERELKDLNDKHVEANRRWAVLEKQVAEIAAADEKMAKLQAEHQPALQELSDWHILAKACAPSGIPTLRIDQALPEISQTSTEMLRECYGPVFTIRLSTQRESADGSKLLEDMLATITRGEEEVNAAVLSGGEQVLVSESISLGLALYRANRSSKNVEVLLRDESGAALDPDRAPAYIRLLRKAAQIGGFSHVLFVTHMPSTMDLADARITVKNGTITVS